MKTALWDPQSSIIYGFHCLEVNKLRSWCGKNWHYNVTLCSNQVPWHLYFNIEIFLHFYDENWYKNRIEGVGFHGIITTFCTFIELVNISEFSNPLPEKEQILCKEVKVTFLHPLATFLINILFSVQCHSTCSLCGLLC